MRTRSRSNYLRSDNFASINRMSQKSYNATTGALINSYVLPAWNYAFAIQSDVDYIVDNPDRKERTAKEVLHTLRVHRKLEQLEDSYTVSNTTKYVTHDNGGNSAHWMNWGAYGDIFHEHVQVLWDVSDHDLALQARHDFFQANDVDTLLNLVEAPDFVSGLKSMYSNVNAPVVRPKDAFTLMRTKKLARFISGGYLYYAFGVAPLISDMKKLSKATASYSKRLQKTLQTAGTEVSVHRRCGGRLLPVLTSGNGLPLPAGYGTSSGGSSCWHANVYEMQKPVKIVTIRGVRNHKYMSPFFQKLDDLATRFGSKGPASFAWERIPFSFVLDWFVDGADVFDRLDNFLTGSRKKITDATISYKWQGAFGAVHHPTSTITSDCDGLQVATNELSYYHRKPIETGISTGLSGRFGKRQIGLTAALLGQMSTNLKLKR